MHDKNVRLFLTNGVDEGQMRVMKNGKTPIVALGNKGLVHSCQGDIIWWKYRRWLKGVERQKGYCFTMQNSSQTYEVEDCHRKQNPSHHLDLG